MNSTGSLAPLPDFSPRLPSQCIGSDAAAESARSAQIAGEVEMAVDLGEVEVPVARSVIDSDQDSADLSSSKVNCTFESEGH